MAADDPDEYQRLEAWRFDQLVQLGVSQRKAALLAADSRVDWHLIEALIRQGCDPEVAARIAS